MGAWRSLNRSSQMVTHRLRWKQRRWQKCASSIATPPQGPLKRRTDPPDAGAREQQQPDPRPAALPTRLLLLLRRCWGGREEQQAQESAGERRADHEGRRRCL